MMSYICFSMKGDKRKDRCFSKNDNQQNFWQLIHPVLENGAWKTYNKQGLKVFFFCKISALKEILWMNNMVLIIRNMARK